MEELHSLDPRRQELLEARFMGGVSGSTGGSTGSTSGGTKVSVLSCMVMFSRCKAKMQIIQNGTLNVFLYRFAS